MVFGGNLGEWCKWVTRMYFYVWEGPIFDVKWRQNDAVHKSRWLKEGKCAIGVTPLAEKHARVAPLGLWFCCGISACGSGQFDGETRT